VDLVKKVGITGKGSALASLSDEEAQKVRDHLSGAGKPEPVAAPAGKTAPTAVRDVVPAERKHVAIKVGRSSSRSSAPEKPAKPPTPAPKAPEPVEPVAEATSASAAPVEEVADPGTPAPQPPKPGSLGSRIKSRMGVRKGGVGNDPVAPVRRDATVSGGKMRSLDRPTPSSEKRADTSKTKRREPRINVKMASLPEVAEPKPSKQASGEPKAQKPDVKLSKDVIAGHRQGMRAPLEELAKEDKESKRSAGAKRSSGLSGFTGEKKRDAGEEDKPRRKLAGMASPRAERVRGKGRGRAALEQGGYGSRQGRSSRHGHKRRKGVNTAAPRKDAVVLELPCTIRSFSEAAGAPVGKVLATLMGMGLQVGLSINSELDLETAEMIAAEMELQIELKASETLEDSLITGLEEQEDDPDALVPRAPIVTFLGHVDHGKTSLLDYLIGIDVVSGEAGGITQHIRAYEVDKDGRSVTFVDTPGHEAFTEMRARGANVTDIAVLVVAADDGIMPQTEEAISHAKAAEVPIVVAMNKIDLEGVDSNRVMTQLTEHQLTPSEWGGDVEVVPTSAIKGIGMDELLETLLTIAELNEYQANPNRAALGVCLESEQQGDRGVVAKLIVQNGTLSVGDVLVCGASHGRVRAMSDTLTGEALESAGNFTSLTDVIEYMEPFTRPRCLIKAHDIHRSTWPGTLQSFPGERVRHCTNTTMRGTTNQHITDAQSSILNNQL
ncbi:MAG: GTP-binding protein, partial [Planctomycetes bacterium]|nr:GTP-binding protein [Planctomycetota bacterium]